MLSFHTIFCAILYGYPGKNFLNKNPIWQGKSGDELNKHYAFVQILMSIVCMYDYVVISMK